MEAYDIVEQVLRDHSVMVQRRANFERKWRNTELRMSSLGAHFQTVDTQPGQVGTDKQFDITATLAGQKFAAAMDSLISPATQRYHGLVAAERGVAKKARVKRWCEEAALVLFARRYRARANFQAQMFTCYGSIGMYGTSAMFIDRQADRRANLYSPAHLSEVYIDEGESGLIDTVHRMRYRSIRVLAQKYGMENLPDKLQMQARTDINTRVEVLTCTKPRMDYDPERLDAKGKRFAHYVILPDCRHLLEDGGYRTFPWAVARYFAEISNETYGSGPAQIAMPAINGVNEQMKTQLRAGQQAVHPAILLPTDSLARPFDMRSGALNRGMVNAQGTPMAHPFNNGARLADGEAMIEQQRLSINDAFLVTLFRILIDEGRAITATEALLRAQEKGQLLSPTMGRTQAEHFGAQIAAELELAFEDGELPPMPMELIEAGGMLEVEYSAPLNRLMRSEDSIAILRSVEVMGPMAQIDPDVQHVMKVKEAYREVCEINGVPERLLNSPEEVAALVADSQQQAQLQQLLAAAPVAASTIKDLSMARATAGNAPPPIFAP